MKKDWQAFGFGLGLGLFVFILGAGLLSADYQCRKLSFGDSTPIVRVDREEGRSQLVVNAFGHESAWDVTGLSRAWDAVCDFSCIPHK